MKPLPPGFILPNPATDAESPLLEFTAEIFTGKGTEMAGIGCKVEAQYTGDADNPGAESEFCKARRPRSG